MSSAGAEDSLHDEFGIMDWVIRDNYTNPGSNSSKATDEINSFYFYQTEQFTLLWLLFGAIVLGNSAVLVALLFSKSSKSRMNFFIMHLAFADLSVGLISVLTDIIWRITVEWKAGGAACKIVRFMQAVVTYASTYVLVALSLDRLDAITRPMNFSGSWRRARLLVGFAWTLSAIFSSPILFLYEERLIEGSFQCWIELGSPLKWQIYMSLVAVTLFVVPALVITACYAVIVYTIWTKSVHITRDSQQTTPLKNGDKHEEADIRRASSRGIIPRAKIKTVKMTFVIVFVFILCWSPYIVFDLLQVYGYVPRTQTNIAVATFIQSLAPLNSAANPVIYCLFSTHICRSLGKLPPFSWICCCLTSGGPESSSSLIDTVTSTLRRATLRTQDNNV